MKPVYLLETNVISEFTKSVEKFGLAAKKQELQ